MQLPLLRSHWDEFDIVWLADCALTEQYLFFQVGYFHRNLPETIWVHDLGRHNEVLIKIPRGLLKLPDPAPVTEEGQLEILSRQVNL